MLVRRVIGFSLVLLFVIICIFSVVRSPVFQHCTIEKAQQAANQKQSERDSAFMIYVDCLGPFTHENHGPITAVFTVILGIATVLLWYSTSSLVKGADITARRELRAYMSTMPDGTIFRSGQLKYFELNYGRTPAKDLEMHVCVIEDTLDAPLKFDGPFQKLQVARYIGPGQSVGKIIPGHSRQDRPLFLYGYVEYTDVFECRWRRNFAFNYDHTRLINGDDEWIAHDGYAGEEERK